MAAVYNPRGIYRCVVAAKTPPLPPPYAAPRAAQGLRDTSMCMYWQERIRNRNRTHSIVPVLACGVQGKATFQETGTASCECPASLSLSVTGLGITVAEFFLSPSFHNTVLLVLCISRLV